MSAAASSWVASVRLRVTTESMSGASSTAIPAGMPSLGTSWIVEGSVEGRVLRFSPGRTRSSSNQELSFGWYESTAERVVGRITPEALTRLPTRLLTSVDLPAPVGPPTTASSGASSRRSRGST